MKLTALFPSLCGRLAGGSLLIAVAFAAAGSKAEAATVLTFNAAEVDDSLSAYLSTDDSILGTLIGSTLPLTASMDAGQTYYLHVVLTNGPGASGFGASISLDANALFDNGTTSLDTSLLNLPYWRSSFGNIWTTPVDPVALVSNVPAPPYTLPLIWEGNPNSGAGPAVWDGGQCTDCRINFSTKITTVPEPGSSGLMLIAGLAGLRHRRR